MTSEFLWRRVGDGKRLHAFYIRVGGTVSEIAACGVGPRGPFLSLPECEACRRVVSRENAA
jgi:hypothetical protein